VVGRDRPGKRLVVAYLRLHGAVRSVEVGLVESDVDNSALTMTFSHPVASAAGVTLPATVTTPARMRWRPGVGDEPWLVTAPPKKALARAAD